MRLRSLVPCAAALALLVDAWLVPFDTARAEPPAAAEGAPPADAAAFPALADDGRPGRARESLLLVVEGLEGLVRPAALRARLSEIFGRPVLALSDPDSEHATATLWVAADAKHVTLRLSTPPRADLWRRLARAKLGSDPAATLINALLDMLWSERMKPANEMRNPFCAPGVPCESQSTDPASDPARRPVEQRVLDPWDPAYPSLDRGTRAPLRGDPWQNEPGVPVSEQTSGDAAPAQATAQSAESPRAAPARWALSALLGGGVHQAGGFARYEVNAVRRFPRFDLGLTFVGGRGQPNAAKARRAVAALAQYRWISEGLEIDLGGAFGLFVAERSGTTDVRPYLRGIGAFAMDTRTPIEILIQSELGTTFTKVGTTGAVEYALTLGIRYAF